MNVLIEFKNRIGVALIRVHYFFFLLKSQEKIVSDRTKAWIQQISRQFNILI